MSFQWFALLLSGAVASTLASSAQAYSTQTAVLAPSILPSPALVPLTDSVQLAQAGSSTLSDAQQEALDELLTEGQDKVEARDYAGAIALYQEATRIDPSNARLFSGIGYLYVQQGQYADAIAPYEQAITLEPDNLPFRYGLAFAYVRSADYDSAIAAYEAITDLSPSATDAYLGLGNIYITLEDYDAALSTYETLAQRAPGNAKAYEALG
ncbi:MAG: tetratricopeptide repeat protein, partial [Leptolyngbyaceae cyanobacterium]